MAGVFLTAIQPEYLQVLATAGVASRRGAEDLILQGKVKVNGKVVSSNVPITRQDKVCHSKVQSHSLSGVFFILPAPDGIDAMLHTPSCMKQSNPTATYGLRLLAMEFCWQAVIASVIKPSFVSSRCSC